MVISLHKITLLFVFFFSLLASILFYIYNPYRIVPVEYNLALGQIADHDIIAPYDFDIFKPEEALKKEQENAQKQVEPIYKISEVLTFNSLKNLDFIFKPFYSQNSFLEIKNVLSKNAFLLSDQVISELMNSDVRIKCYHYLSDQLAYIFDIGILPGDFSQQQIIISKEEGIVTYLPKQLFKQNEAKNRIVQRAPTDLPINVIEELASILLLPNIVIDEEKTNIERYRAKEKIPVASGKVFKNDIIIEKNQKVTTEVLRKIESLIKYQEEMEIGYDRNRILLSTCGFFLLSFILLILFHQISLQLIKKEFIDLKELFVLHFSLLVPLIFTIFFHHYLEISTLLVPYSLSIIIITFIFQAEIGLLFNVLLMLYMSIFLNWVMITPLLFCLSNAGVILSIKQLKYKQQDFFITAFLIINALILNLIFTFLRNETLSIYLRNVLYSIISIVGSVIIAAMILSSIQKKLDIASKKNLFQLTDFDHPLLRRMQKVTPGTYHHSIIVGNLAESAAEAIGADHLLARVGSYFHDIGKMENAKFFIENDFAASELHDQLMPYESAKIIRNHVTDGVHLASKEKLPKNVIAIMQQHHGTSLIRYFYHKAKESNLIINDEDFRYEGPKPQTREAAIVMIADIIESTSKSLTEWSEEIVQKLLNDTISRLLHEDQLNEAPITLQELEIIKKAMMPIILGIYRKRIEYPEETFVRK